MEQLTKEQFWELLRHFRQVKRDFRQEDFARFKTSVGGEPCTVDSSIFAD